MLKLLTIESRLGEVQLSSKKHGRGVDNVREVKHRELSAFGVAVFFSFRERVKIIVVW